MPPPTVLILGAGINGAALARELVLNGVSVAVVDERDLAAGTTAYSTRLIHGGLRYLEHGDFPLVRESLAERTLWLKLAPQFVRPLRIVIPIRSRWRGLASAAARFFRLPRLLGKSAPPRGLWTIRAGLWLYDKFARDPSLPRHRVLSLPHPQAPPLDPHAYPWLCEYTDAQLTYPERFALALLDDAAAAARERGVDFQLDTYHRVRRDGASFEIVPVEASGDENRSGGVRLAPVAVVNATGAWVDFTLQSLAIDAPRLIGGTKGSHFVTGHAQLRDLLADSGMYLEAADGRPVFILPWAGQTLVGTTDEPFLGDPDSAVASAAELEYLLGAVNTALPQVRLTRSDILLHYSGVRPLPFTRGTDPAAIARGHWLVEQPGAPLPCFSLVGGKLTTCRSLAETAARQILARVNWPVSADSSNRPLVAAPTLQPSQPTPDRAQPSDNFDPSAIAARLGCSPAQVSAAWPLFGERTEAVFRAAAEQFHSASPPSTQSSSPPEDSMPWTNLDGTSLPLCLARWVIEHEHVRRLEDLIERRLMLLYHEPLTAACLRQLADLLVAAGRLPAARRDQALAAAAERLKNRYGRRLTR